MEKNIKLEAKKPGEVPEQESNINQSPLAQSLRRHFLRWEPSVLKRNLEEDENDIHGFVGLDCPF